MHMALLLNIIFDGDLGEFVALHIEEKERTSSNKLKRLIQLVTALAVIQEGESAQVVDGHSGTGSVEELMFIMCILVIAGFGAGWIVTDCVVMFILSFMNRFPHQPEVIEAQEEAEEVEEEIEEVPEGLGEEPRRSDEPQSDPVETEQPREPLREVPVPQGEAGEYHGWEERLTAWFPETLDPRPCNRDFFPQSPNPFDPFRVVSASAIRGRGA